jgi:hypothetical protein
VRHAKTLHECFSLFNVSETPLIEGISAEHGAVIPKREANMNKSKMFKNCCGVLLKHTSTV